MVPQSHGDAIKVLLPKKAPGVTLSGLEAKLISDCVRSLVDQDDLSKTNIYLKTFSYLSAVLVFGL